MAGVAAAAIIFWPSGPTAPAHSRYVQDISHGVPSMGPPVRVVPVKYK